MPAVSRVRAHEGPAFLSYGFRPFFLLAAHETWANRAELRVDVNGPRWLPAADQTGKQCSLVEVARNWSLLRRLMKSL